MKNQSYFNLLQLIAYIIIHDFLILQKNIFLCSNSSYTIVSSSPFYIYITRRVWEYFTVLIEDVKAVSAYATTHVATVKQLLKKPPGKRYVITVVINDVNGAWNDSRGVLFAIGVF